jgi:hypothetical protein
MNGFHPAMDEKLINFLLLLVLGHVKWMYNIIRKLLWGWQWSSCPIFQQPFFFLRVG